MILQDVGERIIKKYLEVNYQRKNVEITFVGLAIISARTHDLKTCFSPKLTRLNYDYSQIWFNF